MVLTFEKMGQYIREVIPRRFESNEKYLKLAIHRALERLSIKVRKNKKQ